MEFTFDALVDRQALSSRALIFDCVAAAMQAEEGTVRFLGHYTFWNGYFGSGVAALAGKVGRARGLFFDPEEPVRAMADRSVLVASHVFDAARDSFDDAENPERDTHRCLAQAVVLGAVAHFGIEAARANALATPPRWLAALSDRVSIGYGVGTRDDLPGIARAMGYHLGFEMITPDEFLAIDRYLELEQPTLRSDLHRRSVCLNGVAHNCYAWIRLNCDAILPNEVRRFEQSAGAIRAALRYLDGTLHHDFVEQVFYGFDDCTRDHDVFFSHFTA